MIKMTAKTPLKADFGWLGRTPDNTIEEGGTRRARKPGETNGHLTFMVQWMRCDRNYLTHLLNCDSEEELARLFGLYAKRMEATGDFPFKIYPEDCAALAKNTWADPKYQAAKKVPQEQRPKHVPPQDRSDVEEMAYLLSLIGRGNKPTET